MCTSTFKLVIKLVFVCYVFVVCKVFVIVAQLHCWCFAACSGTCRVKWQSVNSSQRHHGGGHQTLTMRQDIERTVRPGWKAFWAGMATQDSSTQTKDCHRSDVDLLHTQKLIASAR